MRAPDQDRGLEKQLFITSFTNVREESWTSRNGFMMQIKDFTKLLLENLASVGVFYYIRLTGSDITDMRFFQFLPLCDNQGQPSGPEVIFVKTRKLTA